ncbi:MAG TPA: hypothetical protein VHZ07_13885 [Bryobacteraceae bacterium]|jgi:hypothetical protein|nr:hypothetical protein [Bryobacteraceae bacterium]
MCSGSLLGHKGHQALLGASVWLPLLLLFIDRYLRTRLIREAAFAGGVLGMSLLGGYPQTATYMTILATAYFSFRCFGSDDDGQRGGRVSVWAAGLAAICVISVLIASLQLFAVAELIPTITREKISLHMFNQDSLPIAYVGAFLVPGIFGGTSGLGSYYRSASFIEFYSYMGQSALLLAAFAAVGLWNKNLIVRFWVFTGLIAGILCLGLHPIQRLLHLVPVYNLFRAPARHLYEVDFAISVLAVYGLHALLNKTLQRRQVLWALRLGVLAVGTFLMAAVCATQYIRFLAAPPAGAASFFGDNIQQFTLMAPSIYAYLAAWRPTVLFPMIFFVCSACLLWQMNRRNRTVWKILLSVVMVFDIWLPYRTVYANPETTPLLHPNSDSDIAYLNALDRTHYRIYPIDPATGYLYPMMNQIHDLPAINDYSPFWDKRYQSVGEFDLNGESETAYMTTKLMNELGVRYLITNRETIASQLRNVSQSTDPPASALPIPDQNCAALRCEDASFSEPGIISLQSQAGQVAIVQIPVEFTSDTLY